LESLHDDSSVVLTTFHLHQLHNITTQLVCLSFC